MTKWPASVIRFYLGQLTAEALLAAADNPDAKTKKGQVCEANFCAAKLQLQHNATKEATRLFQLAGADRPKTFEESYATNAELRALGSPL